MTRRMPTEISGFPCGQSPDLAPYGPGSIDIPTIGRAAFDAKLEEIAGRPLTDAERQRAEHLAAHNWTLRTIADDLFGEAQVNAFFAPKE